MNYQCPSMTFIHPKTKFNLGEYQTMPSYEYEQIQDQHSNPSPFTWIDVSKPFSENGGQEKIKVIVDTGAGITSLPKSVIENLGLSIYSTIQVRSPLDKNRIFYRKLYLARLELDGGSHEHEVQVIEIQKDYGIIGRDILNDHKIVLHAPPPLKQWWMNCSCERGCPLSRSEQQST
jgi:predicted aspartyl protease